MKPTREQITKEITALSEIKPRVREHTAFGDDNHAAIDAQILVLERLLDENDIWDRWPEDEDDMHVRDSALQARQWLDGEAETDSLVEQWAELVGK